MTTDEKIRKWREENKSELMSLYHDYVLSLSEADDLEHLEDWKTWTETEWTRQNIPF